MGFVIMLVTIVGGEVDRHAAIGRLSPGSPGGFRRGQAWFSVFRSSRLAYDVQSRMINGENVAVASPNIAIPKLPRLHRHRRRNEIASTRSSGILGPEFGKTAPKAANLRRSLIRLAQRGKLQEDIQRAPENPSLPGLNDGRY